MNARFPFILMLIAVLISACGSPAVAAPSTPPTENTVSALPSPSAEAQPTIAPTLAPTQIQPTPAPTLAPMDAFMKILGIWRLSPFVEPQGSIVTSMAKAMGANWVAFGETPCKAIPTTDGVRIDCSDPSWTASDTEFRYMIETAHTNGLRVQFFAPGVDSPDSGNNAYFGSNFTPAQWDSLLSGYRELILHYAQIAEEEHVDLFVIGSEFTAIARKNDWWPGIIDETRTIYHGPLVFGANISDLEKITYWDKLDYIGCNCGTGFDANFTADRIASFWKGHGIPVLERVSAKYGKKVILTEMSYFAIRNAYFTGMQPARLDTAYQAALWEGMFQAFNGKPWLAGWYAGPIMASPQFGGPGDINYSVMGKPAADVIAKWFGGTAPLFTTAATGTELTTDWLYHNAQDDKTFPIPWFGSVRALSYQDDPEHGHAIVVTGTSMDGVGFSPVHQLDQNADYLEFWIKITSRNQPYILAAAEPWDRAFSPQVVVRSYADDVANFYDGKWHLVRIPVSSLVYHSGQFVNPAIFFAWPGDEPATMMIAQVRLVNVQ